MDELWVDDAPLATHLALLSGKGRCHNFHAVPWAGILDAVPAEFARAYRTLLGTNLPLIDGSWAGGTVDSFFAPDGPLAAAQQLAADAFGADATFFGTSGTTTSNRIALASLRHPGARILMDCTAHQSLLFAAEEMAVTPTPGTGREDDACIDVAATARLLADHAVQGRPFDALVLSATGYDGRRLRLDQALPLLAAASPATALVVDEAWSALHAFAPQTAGSTALAVCSGLERQAPVLVTQSAHKTMAALRQGSYLHVLGSPDDVARVRQATYRIHTTSPSWPILASLDLARQHAQRYGATAFARAVKLRAGLEAALRRDPATTALLAPDPQDPFHDTDPLVLRLHVGQGARALRDWLFAEHNVLVKIAGDRLIVRVHLGVTAADVDALLNGLRDLAAGAGPTRADARPIRAAHLEPAIGSRSRGYIIPYPPGVPLARPGEIWTARHAAALAHERARGAEIHHLPSGRGNAPDDQSPGDPAIAEPDFYSAGADR
ncbi:MAG: hypothetical protein PW843_00295 [Azospirillaceae bacterium]|nr:hypothetical protein [Azospirillaceae bacterium]